MDISDQATQREEQERELALLAARHAAPPLPHGSCNNCEAICVGAFCDIDCSQEYDRRAAAAKRNGRKA